MQDAQTRTAEDAPRRTREWSGLILETRYETGSAARRNRGAYSGTKIHRICSEYVVGLSDGKKPAPGTIGAVWLRERQPVLFSSYPMCGCTIGQHAARPVAGATVTCEKCA